MFSAKYKLAGWEKGVSKLLGKRINISNFDPTEEGFSDKTYRITVSSNSFLETYFIKEIKNDLEYLLYKKVVCKIGIPTPHVYGIFSLESKTFMLMEYIKSYKTKWNDKKRYLKAIDLLVKKDLLVKDNWKLITQSKLISKNVNYQRMIRDISRIHEGKEMDIHSSYVELSKFLRRNEDKIKYIHNTLSNKGKLTLCHNDFHLTNVIFPKNDKDIYLIDWKDPNIGSVFIDLTRIINVAPKFYRRGLINYYKSKVKTKEFEYLYPVAEAYDHLGVLSWVVIAVKAQKTKVLKFVDFNHKATRIKQVVSNLS